MKHALYLPLLFVSMFSASVQFTKENPHSLVYAQFFSVDAQHPKKPLRQWLSLPDSVKIFADGKLLTVNKHYDLGYSTISIEQRFLKANFKIILPNNKTTFKAIAKRSKDGEIKPIINLFERKQYFNSKGEPVEQVCVSKPARLSDDGQAFSIFATLAKDERILYLVDNKVVNEHFIAKVDDNFMKKVVQMNTDDSDLVSKFGERAKGFDTVFCIWTSDLASKK